MVRHAGRTLKGDARRIAIEESRQGGVRTLSDDERRRRNAAPAISKLSANDASIQTLGRREPNGAVEADDLAVQLQGSRPCA